MTHEKAAALAAARRAAGGLSLDDVGAQFRFREIALESEAARHRAEPIPAAEGEAEDALVARFLAQHAPPS
jgi:hypothetical protein